MSTIHEEYEPLIIGLEHLSASVIPNAERYTIRVLLNKSDAAFLLVLKAMFNPFSSKFCQQV
jgi:hypothetical protein